MSSDDARKLFEIRREQWFRLCRQNLLSFAGEVLEPRSQRPAKHHQLFCDEITGVVNRITPKLMLIAPRGCGKTGFVSHITPSWYFASHPNANIIAVSHTSELAESNSGFVQRIVRDHTDLLGYDLANDARGRWSTTNGGTYLAAGVGQAIRGFRADLIIVDDPIRSRQEAESETSRSNLWEFYHSDLLPCLKPQGGLIFIATSYHLYDLMSRLEKEQGNLYRIVKLPAFAEADDVLGRAEGEALWLDDPEFGYGQRLPSLKLEYEQQGRNRDFSAQYQCRPVPAEGNMFNLAKLVIRELSPPTFEVYRGWDLASSAGRGDWTVGIKMAQLRGGGGFTDGQGDFIVLDVQRIRGAPEEVRQLVKATAQADGYGTKILIPQDPAQAGADQADSYIRMLSGYSVEAVRVAMNKVQHAEPVASQFNIGRISFLRAPWNQPFIEELQTFPSGQHDDQVDAFSLVFNRLEGSPLDEWMRL